jgi:hypothetical protein
MRQPMVRGTLRPATLVLVVALALAGCAPDAPPVHRPGLAVYLNSRLVWQGSREELLQKRSDYTRGGLHGWTVFGALLPRPEGKRVRSIVAIAADGRHLAIEPPPGPDRDVDPVVYVDREDRLRFTLPEAAAPTGFPHGRGPGDGRGGGGRHGVTRPDTLEDVTEIHVATMDTDHGKVAERGAAGEFVLAIATATERIAFAKLQDETSEPLPDRPGERAWPLRQMVARRTDRPVRRVTVTNRDGDTHVVDAAAWRGAGRLDLRFNRRGLLKFEGRAPGAGRAQGSDLPDVIRVDVVLE